MNKFDENISLRGRICKKIQAKRENNWSKNKTYGWDKKSSEITVNPVQTLLFSTMVELFFVKSNVYVFSH